MMVIELTLRTVKLENPNSSILEELELPRFSINFSDYCCSLRLFCFNENHAAITLVTWSRCVRDFCQN
jgi:hypothetical protein